MIFYKFQGDKWVSINEPEELNEAYRKQQSKPERFYFVSDDNDGTYQSKPMQVQNHNYNQELIKYDQSRVIEVPDINDMKKGVASIISKANTDRGKTKESILRGLNDAKDIPTFFEAFMHEYSMLLSKPNAQPSFFGKGSKLAQAMRDFAKEYLFIDLNPKLIKGQPEYKILEGRQTDFSLLKPVSERPYNRPSRR